MGKLIQYHNPIQELGSVTRGSRGPRSDPVNQRDVRNDDSLTSSRKQCHPTTKEMERLDGELASVEMVGHLSPDRWIRAVMMSR